MASDVEILKGNFAKNASEGWWNAAATDLSLLARAVAREEIERAKVSDKPASVAPPNDNRPTPGGVRVVVYPEMVPRGHIADGHVVASLTLAHRTYIADHVGRQAQNEVDRETLEEALTAWNKGWVNVQEFAARLSLTLSDGAPRERR